jgi:hypothetical protein
LDHLLIVAKDAEFAGHALDINVMADHGVQAQVEYVVISEIGPRTLAACHFQDLCAPQILDPRRTDPVAGPSPTCGMIVA